MRKSYLIVVCAVAALSVLASAAFAGEGEKTDPVKAVVTYPANLVGESAKVVGDTAQKGMETVTKEAQNVGGTLTGDGEAAKGLVVDPIKGTGETAETAVKGVVNAPGEAAKQSCN